MTDNTGTAFGEAASDEDITKAKQALEQNGFNVVIVNDLAEAKETVLNLIPKGVEVFTATSVTLDESGLNDVLNSNDYISTRNQIMGLYGQEDKKLAMRHIGGASEYTVGSVHAVTQEGDVLIASATGSQLPNYAYGAEHVIWVVGSQKIVKDLNEGMQRIEQHVVPLEDVRALAAYGTHTSVNRLLIYRKDPTSHATIVFVKQAVGY